MKHGSGGYTAGCRCDICKEGRRQYRQDRALKIRNGAVDVTHGVGGYAQGCRCEACCTAQRVWHREWERRPEIRARRTEQRDREAEAAKARSARWYAENRETALEKQKAYGRRRRQEVAAALALVRKLESEGVL